MVLILTQKLYERYEGLKLRPVYGNFAQKWSVFIRVSAISQSQCRQGHVARYELLITIYLVSAFLQQHSTLQPAAAQFA